MRFLKLLAVSLLVCFTPTAAAEPPAQTLCVLDFNRLGDDASMDWLQEGLADMIIGTMNGLGPTKRRFGWAKGLDTVNLSSVGQSPD